MNPNFENEIQDTILTLLGQLNVQLNRIKIDKKNEQYKVNIEVSDPSLLIGHRGENIYALQHLIKLLLWKSSADKAEFYLDIDNYRKRQEQNILILAERKVEMARKSLKAQTLPSMSPYFRRLVHMHLTQEKFKDIVTESAGEGEGRYVIIKPLLV